jgi:hypothetical protein
VRRRLAPFAFVALVGVALTALAQPVVLHEFVAPDPKEDLSFATTTIDGDLPAAIQTPSGVATAPDPRRPPDPSKVYSGSTVDDSPESTYEPDRDTRRPNVETYDDPFSPATAPFKRLRAYDAVDVDYTLRVRDTALKPIPVGGSVGSGDEAFYGDMTVDLVPDAPVRIPTVGPGARIVRAHVNPEQRVVFQQDGADNWFVRGVSQARVRLVMQISIPRATFGSELADVDWSALERLVPPQPASHEASFQEVAQAIGVSRSMRPREAVSRMVEYFRSFEPSDERPSGRRDIYVDLALSKKGVCRHRSFAFLVTALGLGIPTRMVVNEAHAWVEVFDSKLWHRIDLGGAALNLDQAPDPSRPPYVPPPDPYSWPNQRDSAQDLVERWREQQQQQVDPTAPSTSDPLAPVPPTAPAPTPTPTPNLSPTAQPTNPERSASEVVVTAVDGDVRRGLPFHVKGEITDSGTPCAHVRVDVVVVRATEPEGRLIGSLSTDDKGHYDGAVVVPRDLELGEYDLVVATPGDARCGAGRSR